MWSRKIVLKKGIFFLPIYSQKFQLPVEPLAYSVDALKFRYLGLSKVRFGVELLHLNYYRVIIFRRYMEGKSSTQPVHFLHLRLELSDVRRFWICNFFITKL